MNNKMIIMGLVLASYGSMAIAMHRGSGGSRRASASGRTVSSPSFGAGQGRARAMSAGAIGASSRGLSSRSSMMPSALSTGAGTAGTRTESSSPRSFGFQSRTASSLSAAVSSPDSSVRGFSSRRAGASSLAGDLRGDYSRRRSFGRRRPHSFSGLWRRSADSRRSFDRSSGNITGARGLTRRSLNLTRPLKFDTYRTESSIGKQRDFLRKGFGKSSVKWRNLYRSNWPLFITTFPFAYYSLYNEYPPIYYDYYDTYGVYPQKSSDYDLFVAGQSSVTPVVDESLEGCLQECDPACVKECQEQSGKSADECAEECDDICTDSCNQPTEGTELEGTEEI